jgi:hypothetical protein
LRFIHVVLVVHVPAAAVTPAGHGPFIRERIRRLVPVTPDGAAGSVKLKVPTAVAVAVLVSVDVSVELSVPTALSDGPGLGAGELSFLLQAAMANARAQAAIKSGWEPVPCWRNARMA